MCLGKIFQPQRILDRTSTKYLHLCEFREGQIV